MNNKLQLSNNKTLKFSNVLHVNILNTVGWFIFVSVVISFGFRLILIYVKKGGISYAKKTIKKYI